MTIPKGLKAGQQIRLAGQGAPGIGGGAAGDLFLELQFEPHPRYRAEGRDLYATLAVAPWQAALGAQLPVATPGGEVQISVPAESQAGRQLRLKVRGILAADAKGTSGDLYLVLEVVLPPARTDAERAAWRRLAEDLAFAPPPGPGLT